MNGRGRYFYAVRLVAIMRELMATRRTAMQLARQHGVHWRTIVRDIDALSLAGVPVQRDNDRRYWIER